MHLKSYLVIRISNADLKRGFGVNQNLLNENRSFLSETILSVQVRLGVAGRETHSPLSTSTTPFP